MASAPDVDAAIHHAYQLYRRGRLSEAITCLVGAIKKYPASPELFRLLADVQHSMGRRGAEAAALDELTSLDPLDARTWRRLASVYTEDGRSEDAYWAYQQACLLNPSERASWEGLCSAALATQRFTRAEQAKDELLTRFPLTAMSHIIDGHIHKARGRGIEARAAYDQALTLEPDSSEAIFNLVDLDPSASPGPLAVRVKALIARPGINDSDAANLNFALARIFEQTREYDKAFACYERANASIVRIMEAKGIRYSPAEAEKRLAHIVATYTASSFRRTIEPLPIDLRLVFIVGLPRSGTSLIEQILASHPRVVGGGELGIAVDCERHYADRRKAMGLQGAVNPEDARELELLAEARERYVDMLFTLGLDAEYVTDKLPGNFLRLGFLKTLFPDSRIVHCRRHPMATCWSLFTANFALHDPYYNSLDHLAHYYRCYQRLMAHWRSVLPAPMIDVHYEDIVSQPAAATKNLLDQIGLNWDDACVRFHQNSRPVLTASHAGVRRPVYTSSLERWRPFESRLGALSDLVDEC